MVTQHLVPSEAEGELFIAVDAGSVPYTLNQSCIEPRRLIANTPNSLSVGAVIPQFECNSVKILRGYQTFLKHLGGPSQKHAATHRVQDSISNHVFSILEGVIVITV